MSRCSRILSLLSVASLACAVAMSAVSTSVDYCASWLSRMAYKAVEALIAVSAKFKDPESFLVLAYSVFSGPLVALQAAKQYVARLMTRDGLSYRMHSLTNI